MKNNKMLIGIIIGIVVGVLVMGIVLFIYPGKDSSNNQNSKGDTNTKSETPVDTNSKTYSLGETIKIGLHEKVKVTDDLEIELDSVADSRCPENTECYWEGELEYSLLVNGTMIKLGTVRERDEDYKNYDIKLANNNSSSEYVLLIVEKDNDYDINDVDDDYDIDDEYDD